ncbi:MAG: hypothetical protein J5529_08880 [Prevotella sp.]|nr:hypothetical protein [Prevotella sp.]
MKQITEEQAIALIKEFQDHSLINLDLNEAEVFVFHEQMQDQKYAYLCEASLHEAYTEKDSRIDKLLQMLKPEIDALSHPPRYFQIQILFSQDAMLMMDELNSMQDFLNCYEGIEIKWSLKSVENETNYIKMQIITVTQ